MWLVVHRVSTYFPRRRYMVAHAGQVSMTYLNLIYQSAALPSIVPPPIELPLNLACTCVLLLPDMYILMWLAIHQVSTYFPRRRYMAVLVDQVSMISQKRSCLLVDALSIVPSQEVPQSDQACTCVLLLPDMYIPTSAIVHHWPTYFPRRRYMAALLDQVSMTNLNLIYQSAVLHSSDLPPIELPLDQACTCVLLLPDRCIPVSLAVHRGSICSPIRRYMVAHVDQVSMSGQTSWGRWVGVLSIVPFQVAPQLSLPCTYGLLLQGRCIPMSAIVHPRSTYFPRRRYMAAHVDQVSMTYLNLIYQSAALHSSDPFLATLLSSLPCTYALLLLGKCILV